MSDAETLRFNVDAEELRKFPWQERLAVHASKDCQTYREVFGRGGGRMQGSRRRAGAAVISARKGFEKERAMVVDTVAAASQLDKIQQELLGYCNLIQPPYFPLLSVERFEGRNLLVLWAPGGLSRPYKVPKSVISKQKEYRYYIRRYSSTVEAKGEDERELIGLTAQVPFDDRVNPNASMVDLSPRLMEEFLREVGSDLAEEAARLPVEALGRQMRVVAGPSEAPLPQNVGLLFFNEHPERFFPVTQIDVVWFPEGAGGDRFEEKVFQGPLGRITRDALGFIQSHYLKQTVVKHPQRAEAERFWNVPYAALEEALVNAVYHRSYEIREPIEVRITPEDIVVLSFPGPDRSIRLEDLKRGRAVSRRYRNRRIGEFLMELDLTEGRCTGISKIISSMKANGSPSPEFETDEDRSYFLIRLPVHAEAGTSTELERESGSGKSSEKTCAGSEETPVDTAGRIVEQLRRNPSVTTGELAMLLKISTRGVEKQLAKLKDSGRIRREGAAKGGVWEVLDAARVVPKVTPEVTPPVAAGGTDHVAEQVTDHVRRLIGVMSGEMSRSELMDALVVRHRVHFSGAYLRPALDAGLVEMTLPDKPNSRLQKYRLTAAGKAWISAHSPP